MSSRRRSSPSGYVWMEPPARGYGKWSAHAPDDLPVDIDLDDPPPTRLQGERPTLRLTPGSLVVVDELPAGDLTRFLLDDEPVDLAESRLESFESRGWECVATFLLSAGDSPLEGRPARMRLAWAGGAVARSTLPEPDPGDLLSVDSIEHDGAGSFRVTVWGRGQSFPIVELRGDGMSVVVDGLDPRRPPYVALRSEHIGDGLWDLATADPLIPDVLDLDELDLSPELRDRIRDWNERDLVGRASARERQEIAEALRLAWPGSVVL